LGYTGEWFDADVGLTYLRARWYDGATGRFTSQDTWEGDHYKPQTLHFYVYVENNSINLVDPSGLCPPSPSFPPDECGDELPPASFAERAKIEPGELLDKSLSQYYHTEPAEWVLARVMYSEALLEKSNTDDEMYYIGWIVKIRVESNYLRWNDSIGEDGQKGPTAWHDQMLKNDQQFTGLWTTKAQSPDVFKFSFAMIFAKNVINAPITSVPEELRGYDSWLSNSSTGIIGEVKPTGGGKQNKQFHTFQNVYLDVVKTDEKLWNIETGECSRVIPFS